MHQTGTIRAGSHTLRGFPDACSAATKLPPICLQPVRQFRQVAARSYSLILPKRDSQSPRGHLKCCLMSIVQMLSQLQNRVHRPLFRYLQELPWLVREQSEPATGVLGLMCCFRGREKRCRSQLRFGTVLGERHCGY